MLRFLVPLRLTTLTRLLLVALIAAPVKFAVAAPIDDLQKGFANPPDDARIMMRWWWFGPAVTKAELERELRLMKEGGIGGFEVQPVYPLTLDDPEKGIRNLTFLSDQFLDALRFTSQKARELGLRFDLTLGSGWPFGGPMVTIDNASARLRYEHVKIDQTSRLVKVPALSAGEKLLAVFLARVEGAGFAADSIRELTDIKGGVVVLSDLPAGQYEALFFISSRTGMQVKRPAIGGEGFVLDHLNRAATDMYLKAVGDRLMQAFPAYPPHAIFCDSLEVYGADWSSDFLEEFKRRRGYDLKPHLPALVNDFGPVTKALRRDWGLTLTELLNERFLAPMQSWSKQHHTLFRIQNYGVPAAALSSNAYADLPEGEGAQWKTLSATRWASSASHMYGRGVTSSETWTWLHSPSFRATPLDMKAEADRHFLEGINQLIGHGWPYTAPGIEYPGWRFYAAAVFNEKNPWWIVMPDVAAYLQRVSFLLRQGEAANEIAIYLPNDDAYAAITPGRDINLRELLVQRVGRDLIPKLIEAGYGFDFFDDETLKAGRVERGGIRLGAHRYGIVVLPNVETIQPETYKRLEEFVRAGGVLIATRQTPARAPGLGTTAADHDQIKQTSQRLFRAAIPQGYFIADEAQLVATLSKFPMRDVTFSAGTGDIGFVHRKTADAHIYFLANTSNVKQDVQVTFRVQGAKAESWNPMTGSVTGLAMNQTDAGSVVQLSLEPYGSRIVVFSNRSVPIPPASEMMTTARTVELSANWQVSFGPGTTTAGYSSLHSWTEDAATRYFSGIATYDKVVNLSSEIVGSKRTVELDFGEGQAITEQSLRSGMQAWFDPPMREAAVIYVNERRAGSVWCPPYRLDVTRFLRAGENRFRIVVANTAMNYMAGHSLPDYRLLNLRYGERFQPQDMDKIQALPSGLLSPIRLTSR